MQVAWLVMTFFSKLSEEDKIVLTAVKEYEDEKDACDFIMKERKLEGRSADEVRIC